MKKLLLLVILIFCSINYFNNSARNSFLQNIANLKSHLPTNQQTNQLDLNKTIVSSDGSFRFNYPEKWTIADMTSPGGEQGKFGNVLQTWSISNTNFIPVGADEVPTDGVKIRLSIEDAAVDNVDKVVSCDMKTTSCGTIQINNQMYKKSVTVLNTGVTDIELGTIKNNKVYLASAIISMGGDKGENEDEVDAIFNSFFVQ